jgi:hypothetical protein
VSHDAGSNPSDLDRRRGDAVWGCAAVAILAVVLYFARPFSAGLWNALAVVLPSAATVLFMNAMMLAPVAAMPILIRGISPTLGEFLFRWLERRSKLAAQFVQILPGLGLACLFGGYIAACAGYPLLGIVVATLPWWGVLAGFATLYRTRLEPPAAPREPSPPQPSPPQPSTTNSNGRP